MVTRLETRGVASQNIISLSLISISLASVKKQPASRTMKQRIHGLFVLAFSYAVTRTLSPLTTLASARISHQDQNDPQEILACVSTVMMKEKRCS